MVCGGLAASIWCHCLSSQILVVVCGDLLWFCGVWWFAVGCGNLRWFVMVCGGLSFSHTDYIDTANTFGIMYMYNKTASHANKYASTVHMQRDNNILCQRMAMKRSEVFRSHTHTHTLKCIYYYIKTVPKKQGVTN